MRHTFSITPQQPFMHRSPRTIAAGWLALAVLAAAPALAAGIDQQAVNTAHRFLRTSDIGEYTLNFVHAGTDYHGHEYLETQPVFDGNGRQTSQFKLLYRFRWEDDGVTDVAFVCDARGVVYGVLIQRTNAEWNQPFALADLGIQLLGNAVIQANKDNMSPAERKLARRLVDDADAHGLLELSLRWKQLYGN